ncbi:hypothetical protein Ptr86124_001033 [Pyrenophora tritici-repentis]|uniref:Uncharacterized protein n=1 Tax=Pyrenophora tritici-repentis TaxID=45151 RepID=A0A922NRA2_9PLEO|nr:hypothetical protein Ptr86124_001033 [Pyrenophora tritici-repentis]
MPARACDVDDQSLQPQPSRESKKSGRGRCTANGGGWLLLQFGSIC